MINNLIAIYIIGFWITLLFTDFSFKDSLIWPILIIRHIKETLRD